MLTYFQTYVNFINDMLSTGNFPDSIKLADTTLVFKKKTCKFRLVSVLSAVLKFFEKLFVGYVENVLYPYLCDYRNDFNTQQALLALIENRNKVFDNKSFVGVVLVDLSKAFDTINNDLLIGNLHAYGVSDDSLKLLYR